MATPKRARTELEKGEGASDRPGGEFAKLPEVCVIHLLSFTTPRDSCRSALVDKAFLSAAESDEVWERFLPSDWTDILSRAVRRVAYSSKKELYFRLCDPILVDGGKVSFQLERSTGKKSYMISAEKMNIIWGADRRYWRWISLPESRFAKVAELVSVCWLDIVGSIHSRLLSRKTTYVAYVVFKLAPDSHGLDQLASVKLGAYASENHISLQHDEDDDDEEEEDDEEEAGEGAKERKRLREDGWLEIELGEFYNDEGDEGDVSMRLYEITELHWKRGLILEGFDVRPKK